MKRLLTEALLRWLRETGRKPLVLRGARQVGKTWLARDLARSAGLDLVEVNFERDPRLSRLFSPGDPRRMLADLGLERESAIDPERSLLFLDEIQAAPQALQSLRWFGEELPELPVVAAGSLIEFVLGGLEAGLPVGRVTYRHVEPLGFEEYLLAHGQELLLERLNSLTAGEQPGAALHDKASDWYQRFSMVGGMPAVVAAEVEHGDPGSCRRMQGDLMLTYRDDFPRYAGRMDPAILDGVLLAVARMLGNKFVYSRVGELIKQQQAKRAVELLARARLVTLAPHSAANGIPLGGEVSDRNRKALLLDVGLAHALLRTPAGAAFPRVQDLAPTVRAQVSEQLAGQQLRCLDLEQGNEPELHYWQRVGGRPGEVDFLVQVGLRIVPVELKSGAAGSMKSLHQFMHVQGLDLAVRIDANPPSLQELDIKTTTGDRSRYLLLNLPGYLTFRFAEAVEAAASRL